MNQSLPLYAVIPSGLPERFESLIQLVYALEDDGVDVIVVNTGHTKLHQFDITQIRDFDLPKNISRWWSRGLGLVAQTADGLEQDEYGVMVLNDDIIVEPGFGAGLADAMLSTGAGAAFPNIYNVAQDKVFRFPTAYRMSGYAFMLRGSLNLRADESLVWWGGDNDLEWRAMKHGGVVCAANVGVTHLFPNSTTVGELAAQAGRDRETFKAKWGVYAW